MRAAASGAPLVLLVLAAVGLGTACTPVVDGLRSHAPPDGTESAQRLVPGPFEVAREELVFVDDARVTAPNGDFPGEDHRSLSVSLWHPVDATGPRPFVVFAHGFTGSRDEMLYLLEHLVEYGAVVAALDFPLTHGDAPGGPTPRDIAPQPGDVRFLIDAMLALDPEAHPAVALIDPDRIALVGMSFGALTTTLATFHPTEREPRLAVAVAIAGPTQMFDSDFFRPDPPFLMLAGSEDGLVTYAENAADFPARVPHARLVTLEAGTHLGFVAAGAGIMRFLHNPDATACAAIIEEFEAGAFVDPFDPAGPNPFAPLEGPGSGVDFTRWQPPCTIERGGEPPRAMRPQRQHHLTRLVVRAFLDSHLAGRPDARQEAHRYLVETAPDELPELRVSHGPAVTPPR